MPPTSPERYLGEGKTMLKIIVLFAAVFFSSAAIATDFWAEVQFNQRAGVATRQINGGAIGENFFAFGQVVEGGYQQIYAGPRLNPTTWLEIGAAAGAETVGQGWGFRFGSYVWAGRDKWFALIVHEDGKETGPWNKTVLKYQTTPELAIGLQSQKFLGNGVRVEYAVNKAISLWGVVLNKDGVTTTQVTIKINF